MLLHRKKMSKLKGYLLPGEGVGQKLGYRGKLTEQGALTSWRPQREGQVRAQKERDWEMGHTLPGDRRGKSHDMERNQLSKERSLPGDHRGGDKSGHGKKTTEQGALTSWRPQREGQVRTQKESD